MTNNNNESCQYRSFLHHFDSCVELSPSAPALVVQDAVYSYRELALMARAIAAILRQNGVVAGSKVAVGISRSESLLPLLLAIWSLRAAYVPVDPSYPLHRQSYIIEHAEAEILVADAQINELEHTGKTILLESLRDVGALVANDWKLAPEDFVENDLAYIIYTSGSTGNPKGVAIGQNNVHNFLLAMRDQPGLAKSDRLLAVTTISFDIHVLELFLPLLVGAQIVLATKEQSVSPQALHKLIDQYAITTLQATPATWRMLLSHDWLPQSPLKILVGGEALPRDLRPLLHKASSELWNMYGPTETTVWSTCQKISANDEHIFIGRPIRRTTVHVVDEQFQAVPAGTPGELLIGGAGVARGYYKSPNLTAERFIVAPDLAPGKLYRTGDLVIQHPDGVLQYLDRLDNQIKIRGFRIEPADIEFALECHPSVTQAVVVASQFESHDMRLIAYYLGQAVASNDLLKHCVQYLPAHMFPQHFVHLEEFPMTANFKVDRKQLAAEGRTRIGSDLAEGPSDSRDDLDNSLIAVWEKTLGIKGIGIDDNFFDLGGHSLLALQVVRDMCIATGLNFPESILFESPSIRGARARMGDQAERAASVVRLNHAQDGEPVFCLCGVKIYQDLADQFDNQRPVYGVFAQKEIGFLDAQRSNRKPFFDFDSLVQSYVDAIRRQGDIKRVSLVGLSFGGLIALEVANKFRELEIEVTDVILLDTYLPSSTYRSFRQVFYDIAAQLRRVGFHSLRRDLHRRVREKLSKKKLSAFKYFNLQEAEGQREKAFDEATSHFNSAHKSYNLDALLIKASDTDFGFGQRAKRDYGLCDIIKGKLTVQTVRAFHNTMITGAAAVRVYEVIEQYKATRK